MSALPPTVDRQTISQRSSSSGDQSPGNGSPGDVAPGNSGDASPKISCAAFSAEELHLHLLKTHRLGNRLHREFVSALLLLSQQKLYLKLGFSSVFQYAERYFGYQRSETYELLRVAKALPGLPLLERAFERGEISWSALKEITKVAKEGTQESWLEFARSHSARRVQAEVKDALEKGRDEPRERDYGLPNLKVKVLFELSPEDHDVLEKALKKVAGEMGRSLGGGPVEPVVPLIFVAERMLETDPASAFEGRVEKEKSIYTILYHRCPDCRRATLPRPDGPVEIDPQVVERVAGEARKVTIKPEEETKPEEEKEPRNEKEPQEEKGHHKPASREAPESPEPAKDRPNPAALSRKVALRDGRACSNPLCSRRLGLHAHHIQFRSEGGRTVLGNEILICNICHALVHRGLLRIEGNPIDGVTWHPRAEELRPDLRGDLGFLASLGVNRVRIPPEAPAEKSQAAQSGRPDSVEGGAPSGRPDSGSQEETERRPILGALRNLGYTKREAIERLRAARQRLLEKLGRPPRVEELLREAISGSGL